jgi:hypothetical protein
MHSVAVLVDDRGFSGVFSTYAGATDFDTPVRLLAGLSAITPGRIRNRVLGPAWQAGTSLPLTAVVPKGS